MRNNWRFFLIFIALVLPLLGQSHKAESALARFVDNGDGTVTDTARSIMWQKGDNGDQVTFERAQKYCKTLRLGNYADWRLPKPDELETAVVVELMMPKHRGLRYIKFDLYWSSDPAVLLPFNYEPSYGIEVLKTYPSYPWTIAYVRAVRSLERAP
jgi:hypothetical protein